MNKRWSRSSVKCPFYKAENPQMIYCDGDNVSVHMAFADRGQKIKYRTEYCEGKKRKDCLIYRGHGGDT